MQTKPLANRITPSLQRQAEKEELQRRPAEVVEPVQGKFIQRQMKREEVARRQPDEEEYLQDRENATAPEVTPSVEGSINSMKGGGRPLAEAERSFFEPRFGVDFSSVRIHTNSSAGKLANQLGAQAFTVGGDVYFGEGQYDPGSTQGKRLIGHELTHVVQQGKSGSLHPKGILEPKVNGRESAVPNVQGGFWGNLWKGAKRVGSRVWSGVRSVSSVIGRGAESAWSWIRGVGNRIGRGFFATWNWIRGVAGRIGRGVLSAWEAVKNIARTIGRGVLNAWRWIKDVSRRVGRSILAAWEWVKDVSRRIGRTILAVWEWVKDLARMIGRAILAAWEWVKNLARMIGRAILAAWEWIKNLARRIGRAILAAWEWLKSVGAVVWKCIKGIRWGASSGIVQKKPLEGLMGRKAIASPSNVFFGQKATGISQQPTSKNINITRGLPSFSIQRYSKDIHYDMTRVEAINVGYGSVQADTVAFEDQAVDTGWRHPWITTPTQILNPLVSGKDMLHFPARSVAVNAMNKAITARNIKAFGTGLHRFQDTFSHNFTTWKIPTRRLCSSLCWKINPLLAAPILLPNYAYGRGAALKHSCLGFYPDEHHGEQKGRDAVMKRDTRAWLKKFLISYGHGSGGGSPASPSPVTFTATAFSASGAGNANLTESAAGLSIAAPTFRSNGTVKVTGDNDEAKKWDVGYIQTVYSSYDIEAIYEKSYLRYHKSSLPLRDAIAGTPEPWYYSSSFSAVTGSGTSVSESMDDTPGHRPSWNDPRVTNPDSLEKYERNFNVVAWLIARRRHDGLIQHLKNANWGFNFIVDVDKTKPVGSRSSNSGRGMDGISTGNGKGPLTPKLTGTISNNANVRTVIPRPPWP